MLAVLLFRPLTARAPAHRDDWEHAERLVHTYGWDTLAYFALRDDKSFFFSPDGEAMIAYTYLGGYALVSGDPIGARESVAAGGRRVPRDVRRARVDPGVPRRPRGEHAACYSSRGFSAFYLGDEAIIDCRRFTLEGREAQEPARGGAAGRSARTASS